MIFRYLFAVLMVATPVWGAATEGAGEPVLNGLVIRVGVAVEHRLVIGMVPTALAILGACGHAFPVRRANGRLNLSACS